MYNNNHKRRAPFNHYGNEHTQKQQPNKPPKSDLPPQSRGNAHGHDRNPNSSRKAWNKNNPISEYLGRLPEPSKCESCQLATAEMQTGMIALLDKLEAEETTPEGDRDMLHHARELRRLLAARERETKSSESKKALDEKRPDKDKYVCIPAYVGQKMSQAKDLPTLPHISEPYLQEAVFTHYMSHSQSHTRGIPSADRISYDRLEFLGDAYIELISSRLIYSRWPHLDVPELSQLREQLVKNETLSKFSKAYGFPDRLKHGGHMNDTKAWSKITADVFEAYVAGLVLSDPVNGFQTAEKWLTELWAPQLVDYKDPVIDNPLAKDELARLVACGDVVLKYRADKELRHENGVQVVSMGAYLTGWGYEDELLGTGEGRNKAQAGVAAATDAIRRNSTVLQFAAKKKQELVAEKQEEKRKEAEIAAGDADGKPDCNEEGRLTAGQTEHGTTTLVQKDEEAQEERKRRKKEKKERREKAKKQD